MYALGAKKKKVSICIKQDKRVKQSKCLQASNNPTSMVYVQVLRTRHTYLPKCSNFSLRFFMLTRHAEDHVVWKEKKKK